MRKWITDRSLAVALCTLFLASWIGQAFAQAAQWLDQQRAHDSSFPDQGIWAAFADADFWEDFWRATLENWQSEFLQLLTFVVLTAYFVFKGSAESKDGDERIEAKLDAIAERVGFEPGELEKNLPEKFRNDR